MKYRHYAPRAPLIIVEGKEEETVAYINQQSRKLSKNGKKAGVSLQMRQRRNIRLLW